MSKLEGFKIPKKITIGTIVPILIAINDMAGQPISNEVIPWIAGIVGCLLIGQGASDFGKYLGKYLSAGPEKE